MIELSVIRDLVAISGVLIALTYYIMNIRHQRETRQTQLFMNLYDTYHSPDFRRKWHDLLKREWTDNEDWQRKYGQDSEDLAAHTSMLSFFNGIGVLLKRGLIDIKLVDDLLGVNIRGYWKFVESNVRWSREVIDEPKMYADFEYLFNEVMKINDRTPDFEKLQYKN